VFGSRKRASLLNPVNSGELFLHLLYHPANGSGRRSLVCSTYLRALYVNTAPTKRFSMPQRNHRSRTRNQHPQEDITTIPAITTITTTIIAITGIEGVIVEGIVVGTENIRVRGSMQHLARITGGMRKVERGKNRGNLGLMVGIDSREWKWK
jgi:hypothetical protein